MSSGEFGSALSLLLEIIQQHSISFFQIEGITLGKGFFEKFTGKLRSEEVSS